MMIHDLKDAEGRAYAFEVDNLHLSRRALRQVVGRIPDVRVLTPAPRWYQLDTKDHFCDFEVGGILFRAWEPWGDNSRFWIGPEPLSFTPQLSLVRQAFAEARPLLGYL